MKRKALLISSLVSTIAFACILPTFVVSCSSNDKESTPSDNVETPDYQISFNNELSSYETNRTYNITANVAPSGSYKYKWTTTDSNLVLSNTETSTVSFVSNTAGTYPLKVSISNMNGDFLTEKEVSVKFVDQNINYTVDILSDDNFNFDIGNPYYLSASLTPSLQNAQYQWKLSNTICVNPISSYEEANFGFQVVAAGTVDITVVVSDSSGHKIGEKTKSITIQEPTPPTPTYTVDISQPNTTYYVNNSYSLTANLTPSLTGAYYEFSCDNSALNISQNQNVLSIRPTVSGNYTINLDVYDSSQKTNKIASKQISINVVNNPNYDITLKQNVTTLDYGAPNLLADDSSITPDWIKTKIIDNKSSIFNIPSTLPSNFSWENNIVISSVAPNVANRSLTFELTLNNKDNNGGTLTTTITFTGFKDQNSTPSSNYVIQFKNQDTFPYGGPNVLPSRAKDPDIIAKIVANKEQIFEIPSNVPKDFNWTNNIRLGIFNFNDAEGKSSFRVDLIGYDSSNPSASTGKTLTFTGYKQGFAYKIKFDETTNSYPFGDPNLLASAITDEQIKQIVINNNTKIFSYGRIPDNFDWNQNIQISNVVRNNDSRSVSFKLTLNNSNESNGTITKNITFNDFKQPAWPTNSMPSDKDLMIDNIKKPNGVTGSIKRNDAGNVLNNYGVVRTFALVNKVIHDSLFVDLGFQNTTISMSNSNFDNITFTITGTASKDVPNWGKKKIPLSQVVENWEGVNIVNGDQLELQITYIRGSTSPNKGTDSFDTSKVQWTPNVTGYETFAWKNININYSMYTTEFSNQSTIKKNSQVVKSTSNDNRVQLMFVNHYNGNNYLIQSDNIISSYSYTNYYFKKEDN
ncbi:MAG: hypothetical protein H9897_01110 [Candidatus Ureaplasma intestinipullorum]|uniref:Lipoprotein n=1 Tax=Candidatus Ureaplasma intestinipullorum TaxID=2838770 RepID=A0A9E2KX77_9BACT|nr:hypothetical protein [Candidatus Ureaplasma intestinipullorum]